jgi:23S rRNA (cytosine1962-C5)-methyltransferase
MTLVILPADDSARCDEPANTAPRESSNVKSSQSIEARIDAALVRRETLRADTTLEALRLFHDRADGIEGLVIEQLGPVLIVQIHEGLFRGSHDELGGAIERLHRQLGTRAVYLKQFVKDRSRPDPGVSAAHRQAAPWKGRPVAEEIAVREHERRFLIRPFDGFSTGLFLEHRDNRGRIAALSAGRRVLNAFAYTCSFSVAAAQGGAACVSSVDLSRKYLEWGQRNFAANDLPVGGHLSYCSDVSGFFRRARRQGRRYDLIILDPPTFAKRRRPAGVFVLQKELPSLVAGAVGLLDPAGLVFLASNDRRLPLRAMEQALCTAHTDRACTILERPSLPTDFAGDLHFSKALLARYD